MQADRIAMNHEPRHRLHLNAPGDWYTTGDCMACGAPEAEAPELFAPLEGENYETYFLRQPASPTEVERCCKAAAACCLSAVRYGGRMRAIIRALGNNPDVCDYIVAWWGGVVRAWPAPRAWQLRR